jgi:GNAT superfamily N-acetyltransferase
MIIRDLDNCSVESITVAFNEAFSDYFIPLQFTTDAMRCKMKGENILLPYSVGAFENDRLVGFILHGHDRIEGEETVYNAGTGVIPAFRGKGLTADMYQYALDRLHREGIGSHVLEVIDNNIPAMKVYHQRGFSIARKLGAYKLFRALPGNGLYPITLVTEIDDTVSGFHSCLPAWQNSLASIRRDKEGHSFPVIYMDGQLVAYAVYVPSTGRVKQCAVHPQWRRKGLGRALIDYMIIHNAKGELVFTNIDESYTSGLQFLHALGFTKFLGLYEMKMQLPLMNNRLVNNDSRFHASP